MLFIKFQVLKHTKLKLRKCNTMVENIKTYEENLNLSRDWHYKLNKFSKEIFLELSSYKKQKLLVIGNLCFLESFRNNFKFKNCEYCETLTNVNIDNFEIIIDAKYKKSAYDYLYKNKQVIYFSDLYCKVLCNLTLKFLDDNSVKYYFFDIPDTNKIKNLNEYERNVIKKPPLYETLSSNKFVLDHLYANNKDCYDHIKNKCYQNIVRIDGNGHRILMDCNSVGCNVIGGKRITINAPQNSKHRIYFFGACIVEGEYVTDAFTIESYVQKYLNKDFKNKYSVHNCGAGGSFDCINDFEYILDTLFRPGDLVIHIGKLTEKLKYLFNKNKVTYYETSSVFDRPHEYGDWLIDETGFHVNQVANEVIGKFIYKHIYNCLNHNFQSSKQINKFNKRMNDIFLKNNPELQKYLISLKEIKKIFKTPKKIGIVIINANPFTLGHRYLIETALQNVDFLYVAVVQEDSSFFSFKNRFSLVQDGTMDLKNLRVIPSGKWCISALSFPEYFQKDKINDKIVDPLKDVLIFSKYIVPALGINVRFVGEEPIDNVTRAYNFYLKQELPIYGVDLYEIPRKLLGNQIISASMVRNLLKEGKFDNIKELVPESTFVFLTKKYSASLERR